MSAAASRGADLVLVDTAGRLHTKVNLMEELKKLRRIVDRTPGALKEVLLVVDATTGQNGLAQARQFAEAVEVTGVVLTKLDGTAKGGIVLAIQCRDRAPGQGRRHRRGCRRPGRLRPHRVRRRVVRLSRSVALGSRCSTPFPTVSTASSRACAAAGRLSEKDVDEVAREIRLALLEADVNVKVVKQFIARVKERANRRATSRRA